MAASARPDATADREIVFVRVFDAPRDRVAKEYGATEGGKQTLERLAAHPAKSR